MATARFSHKLVVLAALSALGHSYQLRPLSRLAAARAPTTARHLGFVGLAPPLVGPAPSLVGRSKSPSSIMRMCIASDVSGQAAVAVEAAIPAAPPASAAATNLGFNTYGDAFRMALSEVEVDVVDVAEQRVDAPQDERKIKGVVSALGTGVVSALNTIFAASSHFKYSLIVLTW